MGRCRDPTRSHPTQRSRGLVLGTKGAPITRTGVWSTRRAGRFSAAGEAVATLADREDVAAADGGVAAAADDETVAAADGEVAAAAA